MGKILRIGKPLVRAEPAGFHNVVRPDIEPDWSLRFRFLFLK